MKKMLKYTTFALLIMTITHGIGLEGVKCYIINKVLFILFVFADKCIAEIRKNTEGGAINWKQLSGKLILKQLYKLPKQAVQNLL